MKTPIIRLTIGQTVSLSGTIIKENGDFTIISHRFSCEQIAHEFINEMRSYGAEFQLVTMRDCADFKRTAAMV